ncbi:MAG: NAD-dependent epimerase/dehydratase family protein [Burkholderiaceae bacterium]
MTVLITGGGGFLGAWLIKRLTARGLEVRVFDRHQNRDTVRTIAGDIAEQIDWRVGDVADTESVSQAAAGCDFAVHLAALLTTECTEAPVLGAQVNLIGTLNVFEAAKTHGLRGVTYASSAAVYGPESSTDPWPVTHYGAYKLASEGCARAYWANDGLPSVALRPLIIYGPGRLTGLTAGPTIACREAAAGRPYTIGYSGAADMIFVDDVAAAFEAAVIRPFDGAHAFSLAGELTDMPDLIAAIRKHIPDAAIDCTGPRIPMTSEMIASDTDAVLGKLPHTSLDEGLARTIAHYR